MNSNMYRRFGVGYRYLLAVLFFGGWGCSFSASSSDSKKEETPVPQSTVTPPKKSSARPIHTSRLLNDKSFLIAKQDAPNFSYLHQPKISQYFTPTPAAIKQLQAALEGHLEAQAEQQPQLFEVLKLYPQYRAQYLGVIDQGRQLIIGNHRCDKGSITKVFTVKDGGACYFQITFDPKTAAFQDLFVNGEG